MGDTLVPAAPQSLMASRAREGARGALAGLGGSSPLCWGIALSTERREACLQPPPHQPRGAKGWKSPLFQLGCRLGGVQKGWGVRRGQRAGTQPQEGQQEGKPQTPGEAGRGMRAGGNGTGQNQA